MKKAFTMVELIVIIIIIGVLAAVALPKFMANKEDAQVATALSNFQLMVQDMRLYMSTHQQWPEKLSEMTSVELVDVPNTAPEISALFYIPGVKTQECLYLEGRHHNDGDDYRHLVIWIHPESSRACDKLVNSQAFLSYMEKFGLNNYLPGVELLPKENEESMW